MRPLRLCVVVTNLGLGGAEHALLQTLARFDPARVSIRLLALGDDDALAPRFRAAGIEPRMLGLTAGRWPVAGVRRLLQAVRDFEPDLLQGWMYHGNLAASFVGARLGGGVPVCWSVRDTPDPAHGHSRFTRAVIALGGFYANRVACIFNVSARSAAYCSAHYGWPAGRTEVLPNGIDVARFRPDAAARARLRGELGLEAADRLVGMVARWTPVKRHDLFLSAAAELVRSEPRAHFALVGKGLDAANGELTDLIAGHGLAGRVHLLGLRHDVEAIYPALDLAVLTSRSEGFPNVLAEALACGVAVVSTEVGDARDIVGEVGRIAGATPAEQAAAWQAALADAAEGAAQARRARIVEHYALDVLAERLQARYAGLLGRAGVAGL